MDLPESEWVHALRGIAMEIYKGEYLAIMGPSGSGESTFFNAIGGLDQPTSGQVFIDEVDIAQLDASELAGCVAVKLVIFSKAITSSR